MLVFSDTISRPNRQGSSSMGSALEASSQRIRYHLRRPIPGRGKLLTRNARNTVKEIVPPDAEYETVCEIFAAGVMDEVTDAEGRN